MSQRCLLVPALLVASACHADVRYDHSRMVSGAVKVAPGAYALRLTSTSGTHHGRSTHGHLTLRSTSAADVSPTTGQRPYAREDRTKIALYGFTNAPFRDVSAPVFEHSTDTPSPLSEDPIFPGVIVDMRCVHDGKEHPALWIGTAANRRAGDLMLDGDGIVLWVERGDHEELSGVWNPAGIVAGDTGTWIATRIPEQPQ